MSLTNPNTPVSQQDLKDFYNKIKPYMGLYPSAMGQKVGKGDIYSTEERMIGQWTDGKPIYQKTLEVAMSGGTTEGILYWKQIDVSSLNIDSYVSVQGILKGTNICKTIPNFEYVASIGRAYFIFGWDNTHILIHIHESNSTILNDIKNSNAYITLCYTKTTDSAISIGDETDYSTTEKIVGTWIDGKPLYQKTVNCGALPNGSIKAIPHNISNASSIIFMSNGFCTNGTHTLTLPRIEDDTQKKCEVRVNASTIELLTRSGWTTGASDYNAYVTLQYTKTT